MKEEEQQDKLQQEQEQLLNNSVFQQMRTRLQQRLKTKQRERRKAAQKLDSAQVLACEVAIVELEKAEDILNARFLTKVEEKSATYKY